MISQRISCTSGFCPIGSTLPFFSNWWLFSFGSVDLWLRFHHIFKNQRGGSAAEAQSEFPLMTTRSWLCRTGSGSMRKLGETTVINNDLKKDDDLFRRLSLGTTLWTPWIFWGDVRPIEKMKGQEPWRICTRKDEGVCDWRISTPETKSVTTQPKTIRFQNLLLFSRF